MAVDGVNNARNTNNQSSEKSTKPGGELGKDEFLKLLVAQMQFQDPLDPQDNAEYVAQLAQFTSVEQMTNLNDRLNAVGLMVAEMGVNTVIDQLNGIIGRDVRWTTKETVDGKEVETSHIGKVSAVKIVDGKPKVVVDEYNDEGTLSGKVSNIDASLITGIGDLDDLKKAEEEESKDKKS